MSYPLLGIWELKVILSIQICINTCQDEKLGTEMALYGTVWFSGWYIQSLSSKDCRGKLKHVLLKSEDLINVVFLLKTKRSWENSGLGVILRTKVKLLRNILVKKIKKKKDTGEKQHLIVRIVREIQVAKIPLIREDYWEWVLSLCKYIKIEQKFWWGKYYLEIQFKNV